MKIESGIWQLGTRAEKKLALQQELRQMTSQLETYLKPGIKVGCSSFNKGPKLKLSGFNRHIMKH